MIYPETIALKKCPSCGVSMVKFALCDKCDLSTQGYVSQWICPMSKGINQRVHSTEPAKPGENRYGDFLSRVLFSIDMDNPVCSQAGILVTSKEEDNE